MTKRRVLAALGLLFALLYGLFALSRSRTFMVMGTLVARVETDRPVVALTFDDGPQPGYTQEVLDTLARLKVRATFFLIGEEVERHPAEARRIVAAGHEVGNHSFTHQRMLFHGTEWIRRELDRTDAALAAAGWKGTPLFRPPYGKKLFTLPYVLWASGRTAVTWDVEPESDPKIDGDARAIAMHVTEKVRTGSIILLHPMYEKRGATRAALGPIIEALKAQKLELVTVSELLSLRK